MIGERTRARWTPEEDQILVDVINRHVESGESLTAAFAAAAELLQGRTAAACGFRWNTELKTIHKLAVQPKRGRRQRQDKPSAPPLERPAVSGSTSAYGRAELLPPAFTQLLGAVPKVQTLVLELMQEARSLRDKLKQAEREVKALRGQLAVYEKLTESESQRDLDMIVRLLQRARQLNPAGHEQVVYERLDSPSPAQSNIV